MIYPSPPPSPDDGDRSAVRPKPPNSEDGNRGAGSWLRSRRCGRVSAHLPLHLDEAFLVRHVARGPAEALMRFRIADADEAGHSRRSWGRRTDVGHQLAGSEGELRLVRNCPRGESGTHQAPIAMLTLNGITDAAPLIRLAIADHFPYVAGREPGHTAGVGVDVYFLAGFWGLDLPERARCRMHLEGPIRLLPDWPTPR
ncbi:MULTISPECIES: hypothetical protein [unclassified Streptomyces]|uniref:hypothetical protein n=1 Tax=unclassified Streptomyces TaxID=2593676 RepID=UPI003D8EE654